MLDAEVPDDSLAMWWLGQAGFAFKIPSGKIAYIDPYLSDAAERLFGFKRLSLAPIAAEDVQADLVVLSHEHADHLDPDAVPIIAHNNPACRFAAPAGCTQGLDNAGVATEMRVMLERDRQYDIDGIVIHTTAADHGDLSPTALSVLLDFNGIRVLCTADTAYRPALLKPLYETRPDLLLPCINGVFGNMGHVDAAMLAQAVRPRYAIPCHYGTFAEHGSANPGGFLHACAHFCPDVQALVLRPGERFTIGREPSP
jgi:L-ascorbate 6-phosphate lactonase